MYLEKVNPREDTDLYFITKFIKTRYLSWSCFFSTHERSSFSAQLQTVCLIVLITRYTCICWFMRLVFVFRTEGQKEIKITSVCSFVSHHRMLEEGIKYALINCVCG